MEELYKLKDMLCEELETYGKKKELTAGSLDVIDKLSHALKSITTVIAMEEAEGGSSYGYPMYYRDGHRMNSYRGSSYARRDSRGRYSREDGYSEAYDEMVKTLHDLMSDAPDENVKREIRKLIDKVERM